MNYIIFCLVLTLEISKMDPTDGWISDKYLQNEAVKECEEGRALAFFKNISKNEKIIASESRLLDKISMTDEHENALIPHEYGVTSHLNRYSDILPFKHSAIKLDDENQTQNSYINANYIPGPFGEPNLFIGCQGPKSNTVLDFWRMVKQENVGWIVMLCKLQEDGRPKCDQYWPDENEVLEYDELGFKIKSESELIQSDNLHKREMTLINSETNEEISKVVQIQYLGWPDHGIPNKKQIDDFEVTLNQTLEEYNRIVNDNTQQKIVIHWSAGIGRTGTLLTLLHIIANLNKMVQEEKEIESISIFSTLRKLREHRFNLVQSSSQYLFLYEYLSKYLKKVKLI